MLESIDAVAARLDAAIDEAEERAILDADHAAWLAARVIELPKALGDLEGIHAAYLLAPDATDADMDCAEAIYDAQHAEWWQKYACYFDWACPSYRWLQKRSSAIYDMRELAKHAWALPKRTAQNLSIDKGDADVSLPPPNNTPAPQQPPTIKTASALQQRTFAPVRYIVPGYIAEGCTILAGRPKIGKSWLMLDAALAVAAHSDVLGAKAEQGDVLYLGLEDNERRLKNRIGKVLGPFAEWPARFHYATEWPRADEGGLDQIRAWIESVPCPRLIVVDVLARFRSAQGRSQQQYEADYAAIAGLQAIASEKNVALVVVHHLRKSAADSDPFDKVSGTLGLSGAADTVLIIDRDGTAGTVLYGRGRDIEEIETAIQFERNRCRWQVLGAASEVRRSDERKIIIRALQEAGTPMTPAEIATATGTPSNNVRYLLSKMTKDGEVSKAGRGGYTPNSANALTPGQRIISPPPR